MQQTLAKCVRVAALCMAISISSTSMIYSAVIDSTITQEGYTINFDNVNIKEFIRFISKIAKVNFIFDEVDLSFNVTIVSEEETSLSNIMSALVQVLRIHDLQLIEEDQNYLIHKRSDVKQIPTVVSSENPLPNTSHPAIITKVFQIENSNPSRLAGIITPLLSTQALVEVAAETRQLIITDTYANISNIALLLKSLDTVNNSLGIHSYLASSNDVITLSQVAGDIIKLIAGDSPILLIPHPQTNTIFIASSPGLSQKAINILRDLDLNPATTKSLTASNTLNYTIQQGTPTSIIKSLKDIIAQAKGQEFDTLSLEMVVDKAQYVARTNSFVFVGSEADLVVIKKFLETIHQAAVSSSSFFLFNAGAIPTQELQNILKEVSEHFSKEGMANPLLFNTILSAKTLPQINSILFTADEKTINDLQSLLASIQASYNEEVEIVGPMRFLIYQIKNGQEEQLRKSLHQLADSLEQNHYTDPGLIEAIDSMQWIKSTNSLIFTGHEKALIEIQTLLPSFDVPPEVSKTTLNQLTPSTNFISYRPIKVSPSYIVEALHSLGENLEQSKLAAPDLLASLNSSRFDKTTDQVIITGTPATLERVNVILRELDQEHGSTLHQKNTFTVPINYAHKELVENSLKEFANSLPSDDPVVQMIQSMHWLPDSQLLVFQGSAADMNKIRGIIERVDIKASSSALTTFSVIKLQNDKGELVVQELHLTAKKLSLDGHTAQSLIDTLNSTNWNPTSGTILLTGTKNDIDQVKELINTFDIPTPTPETPQLDLYKLQYISGQEAKNLLIGIANHSLAQEKTEFNQQLFSTVDSIRIVPNTNTIQFVATPTVSKKIKEIIANFDIPGPINEGVQTDLYKLQYISGEEAKNLLMGIANYSLAQEKTEFNQQLFSTVDSIRIIPNTNTIQFFGTPSVNKKIKELVATFDIPTPAIEPILTDLFKLQYISAEEAKTLLIGIAQHALDQGKNEFTKQLSLTIDSIRVVPNTNAIQFVGTPTVNKKIEEWLTTLDNPANAQTKIKQLSGTSFIIYQVKNTNAQDIINHLNLIAKDLKLQAAKAGPNIDSSADIAIVNTIQNARILPPPQNSIVFTGPPAALAKIQNILEYLDIAQKVAPPAPRATPEGYQLYSPKYVRGPDLIQYLKHFEQHLYASGVEDQDGIVEVVDHLSFLEKTNTIIVSGSKNAVDKVVNLLERFDVQSGSGPSIPSDNIEVIDDVGFLNYKIQFHNGSDIVGALKAIGNDLKLGKENKNQTLLEAIQSVQWIEVTNSIIASGQPRILTKVKELIESVDQPLKQVFIEVLVLETHVSDSIDFGLRWASQGKYKDQLAWNTGMFQTSDTQNALGTNLTKINATRTPTGADIPSANAGYLGVIGDIITHKGQAYATLASLLTAVKSDGDITVVLSQKIITQDNRNSKIFVGDNVPFTGSLVTTAGLSQTTNANLEYRNIGVTLSITPFVGNNGIVTLDIDEEISEEENTGTTSSSVNTQSVNGIRTSKTSMQTRAHVPDQHFLVLSGMVRNSTSRFKEGIPCLGGLPVIGAAFSQVTKVVEKKNVIIFVKPHIIDSPSLYDQITRKQEGLFGSKDQCNQEDYQAGIEIVRSVDDQEYE